MQILQQSCLRNEHKLDLFNLKTTQSTKCMWQTIQNLHTLFHQISSSSNCLSFGSIIHFQQFCNFTSILENKVVQECRLRLVKHPKSCLISPLVTKTFKTWYLGRILLSREQLINFGEEIMSSNSIFAVFIQKSTILRIFFSEQAKHEE